MTSKTPRDVKSWKINSYPLHIELYDSEIIIKDECGNSMNISKQDRLSLIVNLKGSFVSSKKIKKERFYLF